MIDERFTSSEADLELKKFEKNFKKEKNCCRSSCCNDYTRLFFSK